MAKQSQKAAQRRREAKRHRRAVQGRRSEAHGGPRRSPPAFRLAALDELGERILVVAEPLIGQADSTEQLKLVLDMAVLAWNAALYEDGPAAIMEVMAQAAKSSDRRPEHADLAADALAKVLTSLLEFRLSVYPSDDRFVVQHELVPTQGKTLLLVSSVPVDQALRPRSGSIGALTERAPAAHSFSSRSDPSTRE